MPCQELEKTVRKYVPAIDVRIDNYPSELPVLLLQQMLLYGFSGKEMMKGKNENL